MKSDDVAKEELGKFLSSYILGTRDKMSHFSKTFNYNTNKIKATRSKR